MKKIKILCVIPARSGSKGIINKNIIDINGLPLFVWSIRQAKLSKYSGQMKIVVTTDSKKYQNLAKKHGAEAPFLRPKSISKDKSLDIDFFKHCVEYLKKNENYTSDIILHLRPTQPFRKVETIDECLDLFIGKMNRYTSLRTVIPIKKSPFKTYLIKNNILFPLFNKIEGIKEPYNQCRQNLPQAYLHNGYVDIFKSSLIYRNTISGDKILPFVMNENDCIDIDSYEDISFGQIPQIEKSFLK